MLKIKDLSLTFNMDNENRFTLFDDFSMTVEKGQFVSIIGSNGSGKSSLLNFICGSLKAEKGKVILNNNDITNLKEYKRSEYIGRVFQDPALGTCPSMTILENMAIADCKGKKINLGFCVNKKRIDLYKDLLRKLNLGLEDKLDTKVGQLSGGQRQALALLISTTTALDLIVLDEHTAALDPKTCETIMKLTEEIIKERDTTTIMITHNLKYALEYGNRLIMMKEGKIVMDKNESEKKDLKLADLLYDFNNAVI